MPKAKTFRIMFNEITERAVKAAFLHPGKIDLDKVNAQQARRVLDRLVGYKLSPLLWEKVRRGLSGGAGETGALPAFTRGRAGVYGLLARRGRCVSAPPLGPRTPPLL